MNLEGDPVQPTVWWSYLSHPINMACELILGPTPSQGKPRTEMSPCPLGAGSPVGDTHADGQSSSHRKFPNARRRQEQITPGKLRETSQSNRYFSFRV